MFVRSFTIAAAFFLFLGVIHLGLKSAYVNTVIASKYPIERDRAFWSMPDVRTLFLGNSHVQMNLAPVEGAYNLASFDESYVTTYYRLREIIRRGHQPDLVIMHLSVHSFRSIRPVDTQQPYWARIIDYTDIIRHTGKPYARIRDCLLSRELPYTGGVRPYLEYLRDSTSDAARAQLASVQMDFSQATDQFSQAVYSSNRLISAHKPLDEEQADYLARILDLCEEHDIQLVLVRFPITRVHYELISEKVDPQKWQAIVDERLAGRDAELIDYSRLYFDDYTKFMDPVHLNAQSKEAFTNLLLDELRARGITLP